MSIPKGAVAAAVVWSASIAFAGVVFILLRAPVVPPRSHAIPLIASDVAVVVEPPATVLEIAPMLIVGERPARATPTGAPSARQVRCGEWRALAQGDVSQRVRACE